VATKDIKININGKYSGKSAFAQAASDVDKLDKNVKKTDASLKKSNNSMGSFGSKSSTASNKLTGLGGSLGKFNSKLGNSVSKLGGASGALAAMSGSMGMIAGAAVAAGAAIGTFALLSYQKAVASQAEWAKFKGIVESAGQSFDNSKQVVRDFAMVSGQSVADVRGAFQQLTQTGINPSNDALRSVRGMAIGLKTDMTSAAIAYSRIVKGGPGATRTLTKLGITMEEVSTGGKIDTAKLNAVLEEKFGTAGDNFSNSAEASGIRLQTAIDGLMVNFGNLLLGPGTAITNGLAFFISGITKVGQVLYNLFGGADAFSQTMQILQPILDTLSGALTNLFGGVEGTTGTFGILKPLLTVLTIPIIAFITILTAFVKMLSIEKTIFVRLAQYAWIAGTWIQNAGQKIYSAAMETWNWLVSGVNYWNNMLRAAGSWIRNIPNMLWGILVGGAGAFSGFLRAAGSFFMSIPGRAWGFISSGVSSFASSVRSAGQSLWNAIRGAPGWIYSSIVNAIPRIQWPSWGDIAGWIKGMIWGSRGPGMGIGRISGEIANQSSLRASNLAAQRAAVKSAYQASPAAQSAANTATNNMGVLGGLGGLFRGPGDWKETVGAMKFNYQNYAGSKQKAWDGSSNCMTGNCVDMSLGVLNAAAASGAKGGSLQFGTWNGGPHVWANIDGVNVDPARKALNGTFAPPARGPGDGNGGVTVVLAGPVYGYDDFVKRVQQANDKMVNRVF
jgi:hypothetical protein